MSNRLFQSVIYQMKDAVDRVIGVLDHDGTVIACSDLNKIGENREHIISDFTDMETIIREGFTYKPIGTKVKIDYVVFVEGTDGPAEKYAAVIGVSIVNIKQYYDEKYDKANFIKNVILDNILPGDIFIKARELHFSNDVLRAVLLIRICDTPDVSVYDVVQNLFPDKQKDYVINVSETDIALIKEVHHNVGVKDLEKLAKSIVETLGSEFYTKALVGIGTIVNSIKDLNLSYKEAQVALEVGKVFDTEKSIVSFENLGIARLIYQLPTTLCEMFLHEVFKRGSIESLDQETLFTIQKFFENNLNVSETSRKLFVHRNTLVYRLEKVKKLIGLDLREFEDAIIFKVALMVKKYLDSSSVRHNYNKGTGIK